MDYTAIGKRIRAKRKQNNLSQEEFAEKALPHNANPWQTCYNRTRNKQMSLSPLSDELSQVRTKKREFLTPAAEECQVYMNGFAALDIPPCRRYVVVKATAGFAVCRLILKLLLFYSCLDFTQNLGKTHFCLTFGVYFSIRSLFLAFSSMFLQLESIVSIAVFFQRHG